MRYLELFAGAGGLSMGLEAAGMVPVAHAEIEPNARAVLRYRWPDTELLGDVSQVDGAVYRGRCEVVAGGSPCQDLSVAGKRAGLGGARSGLFHQQARIWEESGAPYLIWENVVGALSSQNGRDFAVVLSTLVGAPVPVPADGWRTAGVAAGATGVAAWRVLDLQHLGPPQRRRRVFVVAARAGGCDPAEVLALSEGVCGHPAPRDVAREKATGGAHEGAGSGDENSMMAFDTYNQAVASVTATLSNGESGRPIAINISDGQLRSGPVVSFKPSHYTRGKDGAPSDVWPPLSADADRGDQEALAFHHTQDPISGPVSPALGGTTDGMGVVGIDMAPTLMARDYKGPRNFQDGALQATVFPTGRPRRLMPLECERLMGWPDGWTATGKREDGTAYALSDSARYRLCGNGVGAPVAEWIGRQLVAQDTALRQESSA